MNVTSSWYRDRVTATTLCPCWSSKDSTSSPNCARSRDWTSGGGSGCRELATPLLLDVLGGDLLLEPDDPLEQRLRPGRAARDVDVDRQDLVDALGDRVRVPVRAAAVGARAHRDHVLRVGHLLVEPLDRGCHLVGDGAGDDDEIGLTGAGREGDDPQ